MIRILWKVLGSRLACLLLLAATLGAGAGVITAYACQEIAGWGVPTECWDLNPQQFCDNNTGLCVRFLCMGVGPGCFNNGGEDCADSGCADALECVGICQQSDQGTN